jgi:lysophospholipase L1-like esterase
MIKILMLGDSLIADYDWQARLPAFQVENLGVPGATAGDLLASLPTIKDRAAGAEVIVIMIGTNDILAGSDEFQALLKKILIQLSHDYPQAEILVNSLLPMAIPDLAQNAIDSLNNHIEALTMQTGCCYLDVYKRFSGSDKVLFQEDGVHITEAGYAIWARALLEHLAFLIENDD